MHTKLEIRAQQFADLAFRIALNFKSAATRGSFGCECGKDEMSPRMESLAKNTEIALTIAAAGEKMEHRSVVPNRKGTTGPKIRDVCINPKDTRGRVAQPSSCVFKGVRSDINDSNVGVTQSEQLIDKS